MLAVSGKAEDKKTEPYSPQLVKKAEAGEAGAQFDLGYCYDKGKGVTKDYKEAVKWYAKAAEQGNVDAQYNLGSCYFSGEGVTKDYQEAVKWFTKAAKQGSPEAKKQLELLKSK
jgi:TPR repeat protein